MKRLLALLVTLCAALIWYGAEAPMDEDEIAERFRRAEGL